MITQNVCNTMNDLASGTTFDKGCLISQKNFHYPADPVAMKIILGILIPPHQVVRSNVFFYCQFVHLLIFRIPKYFSLKFYFQIKTFWILGFHLVYFPFQFLDGHNRYLTASAASFSRGRTINSS